MCCCLGQIAKHSVDLAEVVVEAEVFPNILKCLRDSDLYVRKNAATCIREIAKHTPEVREPHLLKTLERRRSPSDFLIIPCKSFLSAAPSRVRGRTNDWSKGAVGVTDGPEIG